MPWYDPEDHLNISIYSHLLFFFYQYILRKCFVS